MDEDFPYKDIIHLQRPAPSKNRKRLTASQRAAQFMPFAALTGFEAAVQQAALEQSQALEEAQTPTPLDE